MRADRAEMENPSCRRVIPAFVLTVSAGLMIVSSGCSTGPVGPERLARYRPSTEDRDLAAWRNAVSPAGVPAISPPGFVPGGTNTSATGARVMKAGDKVVIYLRDIPLPEEIKAVIDEQGDVNLPLIKRIRIAGKTTFESEDRIQKEYIDGGFYKKMTVIIVAQEDEYFVQGEVKREGRYPLSGELTLLRAITTAGGYTDYASPGKVKILRGDNVSAYDCERIAKRKADDPLIRPGDIVIVPRTW